MKTFRSWKARRITFWSRTAEPALWSTTDLLDAIPVPPQSLDGRHAYLKFTELYNRSYDRARSLGRLVRTVPGTHYHPINEPAAVAQMLVEIDENLAV